MMTINNKSKDKGHRVAINQAATKECFSPATIWLRTEALPRMSEVQTAVFLVAVHEYIQNLVNLSHEIL